MLIALHSHHILVSGVAKRGEGTRGPAPLMAGQKKIKIDISDFEVSCAFRDALFSSYTLLKDDITVIGRK